MKTTREQWLNEAVGLLQQRFLPSQFPPLKVCIGFPPKNAMSKRRVLGVCVMPDGCMDRQPQIYINPTIQDIDGPQGILAVLTHELVHALGVTGHGKQFKKIASAAGLEGNMASSYAGDDLCAYFDTVIKQLGPIPHSMVKVLPSAVKPDKCRMHKCVCAQCGYTVRIAQKWISIGVPNCPACVRPLETEILTKEDQLF